MYNLNWENLLKENEDRIIAHPIELLREFLADMEDVVKVSNDIYSFKNARISLSPASKHPFLNVQRTKINIKGDDGDCVEFYKNLLMNYLTMGG